MEKQPLKVTDLPGPGPEDAFQYNQNNHDYLTDMHEVYGDEFVVQRNGRTVAFFRSPGAIRDVLMNSDDFAKVWETEETAPGAEAENNSARCWEQLWHD